MTTKILCCVAILALATTAYSQNDGLYSYQDLSHFYYAKAKDSIRRSWSCPTAFKDRSAQKKFKEIWDKRTDALATMINEDDYVHDKEVYGYVESIVRQIAAANQTLVPETPFLLIDRSAAVNAYALGGNILAVNLGLITFSESREELALAIAHEMVHNILHHVEDAMQQYSFKFSRSRHRQYRESDADSLAVLLLKKSDLAFEASWFLHLDSADMEYQRPLTQSLQAFFTAYHLPYDDIWSQRRNHDQKTIVDSLTRQPENIDRYNKTLSLSTPNAQLTPIPASLTDKANKMLVWNLYSSVNLTPCLYRILQIKDKGNTDTWYDFMLCNVFAGLYYSDRMLNRFNAIGVIQKEYISRDYYALQTLLEQIPRESLMQSCRILQDEGFWRNLPEPEKDLKALVFTLALDPDTSDRNKARAAHVFFTGNANSMYCEFAQNFEKK